ncbi:MAG: heavy metal translocating P-type ATPase [Deltaproteobacteria bacterium]|nr:MAG: heavy metal translocating P-type ATPase [Deltaproteobacteria bacterium]
MHDIHRDQLGPEIPRVEEESHPGTAFDFFIERYGEFVTPLVAVILVIIAWIQGAEHGLHSDAGIVAAMAAVAIAGYPIVRNAILSTLIEKKINAEVLVAIALIASVWVGEYIAGALVALMMLVGELLEDLTIARTGQAIRSLMELSPLVARVLRHGHEVELPIEDVVVGDIVVVWPGEKIPVDGTVLEGCGEVDQAAITGESLPVAKNPGDMVYGGTLNQLGALKINVSRVGEDSTLAQIVQLVSEAQRRKPPIERIADRFAAWFTPVILALAILVWVASGEVLRAVTVLVVACPCAMVIATPTAVVAGIGNAARKGILIKGGEILERLHRLRFFAFDKTGTLTQGRPDVVAVASFSDLSSTEIVGLAASAEKDSGHPLAAAILQYAARQKVAVVRPRETELLVGRGVRATVVFREAFQEVLLGNERLLNEAGIEVETKVKDFAAAMRAEGATAIFVTLHGSLVGGIGVADVLRPEAAAALADLRNLGAEKLVLLSGDSQASAEATLAGLDLDEVFAGLLPEEKLAAIKKISQQGQGIAMVGDGVNDAPALVAADVGIAMGAIGTDTAIAAADIALTSDNLGRVADAIALARATITIIKQSFAISLVINVLALVLAAFGGIGPVLGAFIHNIGSVIVVANSSRLIGYRRGKKA